MRMLFLAIAGLVLGIGCGIPKGPGWDCFLVARALFGSDKVNATPAPKDSKTRCFAPPPDDADAPLVVLKECAIEDTGAYFNCTPDVATPAQWLRDHKVTLRKPENRKPQIRVPALKLAPPLS